MKRSRKQTRTKERIAVPAIRYPDGMIFLGRHHHGEAWVSAVAGGRGEEESCGKGFMTTHGRYLDGYSEELIRVLLKSGQMTREEIDGWFSAYPDWRITAEAVQHRCEQCSARTTPPEYRFCARHKRHDE